MAKADHSQTAAATKRRRFSVRIALSEHRRVKSDANREGVSIAEYTRQALLWYLANRLRFPPSAKAATPMGTIAKSRAKSPTYRPTKSELALTNFHGVDGNRRKAGGREE